MKYTLFIIGLLLGGALSVSAAPVSWDFTANVLRPLQSMWGSEVRVPYITATSTTATNTLPILSSNTICLTGDCRTSWPTGGSGGGLSTTSPWTNGNLAYVTGLGTVGSVATGTLTESVTGLELDQTRGLVGGSAILSLTSGYGIPLTASSSNWNSFYDTPSGRITAGTNLSWSSNTLNAVTQISTSSSAGNLAFWTGTSALGNVATGTLTEAITGLQFDQTRALVGGSAVLSMTAGYTIASSSDFANWNSAFSFYTTPSTRITAGNHIDWTSNTLDVVTTGDWTGTIDGNNFAGGAIGAGELLYGSGAGSIAELTLGASSTILTNNGTSPLWATGASLCVAITGSADLCDGNDGGGAGSSNWTIVSGGLRTSTTTDFVQANNFISTSTTATSTFAGRVTIATTTIIGAVPLATTNGPLSNGVGLGNVLSSCDSCGSATGNLLGIANFGTGGAGVNTFSARGTTNAPTATLINDTLYLMGGRGYGSTTWAAGSRVAILMQASENWTDAAQGTFMSFQTTANGSTTRAARMLIDNAGNVGVGTTTPSHLLTVNGNLFTVNASTSALTATGTVYLPNLTASRSLFLDSLNRATTTGTSQFLRDSLSDEAGSGPAVFASSTMLTSPTLVSFFGTPCTGNTFLQDISDTGAFTCVEATGGGGGGGALSTTTDIIGMPSTPELVSYVTGDVMFGGSASTTAEFQLDDDGAQFIISSSSANATATIESANTAQAVRLGDDSGVGIEWIFSTAGRLITRFYGSITEWFIEIAKVAITGKLFVATTTYNGATTTDAIVTDGYINSGEWLGEFCTSPVAEVTQIAADTLRGCGRYAYIEDAAGVLDFVAPTTGTSSYFLLRPGAAGDTVAAGDGMGIGWASGLDFGDIQKNAPAMEWAWRMDRTDRATSTFLLGGVTDKISVNADFATEPGQGIYVTASSTTGNFVFACNPSTGATTYVDTGIASTTSTTASSSAFTHFRLEVGGTANTAVTGILKARTATNKTFTQVGACQVDLSASTQLVAPTVGIGKSAAGRAADLHVMFLKFWYRQPVF